MSGRIIPTVLEKGWGFSGVGPCRPCSPLCWVSDPPWRWQACPPAHANVLLRAHNKAQAPGSQIFHQLGPSLVRAVFGLQAVPFLCCFTYAEQRGKGGSGGEGGSGSFHHAPQNGTQFNTQELFTSGIFHVMFSD